MPLSGLSIIIFASENTELTQKCLASLASQMAEEIILVVADSSGQIVGASLDILPQIKILACSGSTAWSKALQMAHLPLICIISSPIILAPGCLEALARPLQMTNWIGLTCPALFLRSTVESTSTSDDDFELRVGCTGVCFVFRNVDFPEGFETTIESDCQFDDLLYTLLFKRRGLTPFRWPVPGKVPVVVSSASGRRLSTSIATQTTTAWTQPPDGKRCLSFQKKWGKYEDSNRIKDIPWEKMVFPEPSSWSRIAEQENLDHDTLGPLVSVIIPCHNRPRLLAESLESVVNQIYSPLEIIIVDDASSEPLLPVIRESLSKFRGAWQFIEVKYNSGPGVARRIGTSLAQGKFLQYLDSDDLLDPTKLGLQVRHLEQHPELVMTYAVSSYFDDATSPFRNGRILGRTNSEFSRILPELLLRIVWGTSSCLWRRILANDSNLWKPLYGPEDLLFDFLVGLKDLPISKTPGSQPLFYKRTHDQNISSGIATNLPYQQEILKAYDYMWQALQNSPQLERLRHPIARLYADKIMTFLVFRRYWEVQHCINCISEVEHSALPFDVQCARLINIVARKPIGFSALRKWRWMKKFVSHQLNRVRQRNTLDGQSKI